MIKRHPYFIGSIAGGLLAVVIAANSQTIGPVPAGNIGVGNATSLAINGCTIGTDNLCVSGTSTFTGNTQVTSLGVGVAASGNTGEIFAGIDINLGRSLNQQIIVSGDNTIPIIRSTNGSIAYGIDAAAAQAVTFQMPSVAAGTANTKGANFTITASRGTGTLSGGNIVFQTAPPGLAGSNQNPLVSALIIDAATHLQASAMTPPGISSCGGGSPAVSGSDTDGQITFGTTATTCNLTWTNAYNNKPYCTVTWQNSLASMQYTPTNSTLSLAQTSTSGNVAHYHCVARNGG